MSIRFICPGCDCILGIAERKIGSQITCPNCGEETVVPALAEEGAASARPAPPRPGGPPSAGYRDIPHIITDRPFATPAGGANAGSTGASQSGPSMPSGYFLVSRRAVYVQGLLLAALTVVALLIGYAIGRGDSIEEIAVEDGGTPGQTVLIEGSVSYTPVPGKLVADADALLVILPAGKTPDSPMPIAGFKSTDRASSTPAAATALRRLGGQYVRADSDGAFTLVVGESGDYRVLVVSRHAKRRDPIPPGDLQELSQFFDDPAGLIGEYRYQWLRPRLSKAARSLPVEFGE